MIDETKDDKSSAIELFDLPDKSIALQLFEVPDTPDEIPLDEGKHVIATDETKDDKSIALELFELPETPDEIPLAEGQRVVATGDAHGDFQTLKLRLMGARLIVDDGDEYSWVGGNTVLVQLGDIVDRGKEELRCILLLCKLGRQAKKAGGAVVVLWGNHELMNASGDYQCASSYGKPWSDAFEKALDRRHGEHWRNLFHVTSSWDDPARWAAMEPGGLLSVPFLSKLKVMVKVGRSVFVHAGFYAEDIKGQLGGIAGMNLRMQKWILEPFEGDRKIYSIKTPKCLTNTLWMRDYSQPANIEPTSKDALENVKLALASVDADRMVVGHTQQQNINTVLGGTMWRVDLVSQLYRYNPCYEALEIMKPHHASGADDEVASVLRLYHK